MSYSLVPYRFVDDDLQSAHIEGYERTNNSNVREFCCTLSKVTESKHVHEAGLRPELHAQRPVDVAAARKLLADIGGNAAVDRLLSAMAVDPDLYYEVSN